MAAPSADAPAPTLSVDQVLRAALGSDLKPETMRALGNALRKFSIAFETSDAGVAYTQFGEVRRRFAGLLAEHSVKHYVGALHEAARLPLVSAWLRERWGADADARFRHLDEVAAECAALSGKVPRRSRAARDSEAQRAASPPPGAAGGSGDTEAPEPPSAARDGAAAEEEAASLWRRCLALDTENAVLRAQLECTLERVADMSRVVAGLIGAPAALRHAAQLAPAPAPAAIPGHLPHA